MENIKHKTKINKLGGSLAIIIPSWWAKTNNLNAQEFVSLELSNNEFVVKMAEGEE